MSHRIIIACGAIRGSHRTSGGGGAEASGDASLRVAAGATDASLLYRDAFGEVAGLVDIQTLRDAHVIAEKLKGNHGKTADEVAVDLGDIDRKVVGILDIVVPVAGQAHEIGAAGLALGHVADGFLIEIALRQNADDQGVVLDQADGAVLHLAGGIGLAVNIADLLHLEAALEADGIVEAAADEEDIAGHGELGGKPLDALHRRRRPLR